MGGDRPQVSWMKVGTMKVTDEVNQEESEQNEVNGIKKEADSTGKVNSK